MRAESVFPPVKTPVGDPSRQHRGARALAPFRIRPRADDRVDVDDGGRFHPGAVLSLHRDVAGQIGRARLQDLDAAARRKRFPLPEHADDLWVGAQRLPLFGIDAALQVTRVNEGLRHVDELVGVQIEIGEDRVVISASVLVVILQKGVGRAGNACDVVGLDESLRSQRFGVSNQQFHCLLARLAFAAVEHGLFGVGEFHALSQMQPRKHEDTKKKVTFFLRSHSDHASGSRRAGTT